MCNKRLEFRITVVTKEVLVSGVTRRLHEIAQKNWKRWGDYTDGLRLFLELCSHKMKCCANMIEPPMQLPRIPKRIAGLFIHLLSKRQAVSKAQQ